MGPTELIDSQGQKVVFKYKDISPDKFGNECAVWYK
jgi:hypothetical protein